MNKQRSRRRFLAMGAAAAVLPATSFAQAYPSRPIRLVVGVPPGGSVDTLARSVAQYLTGTLGVTIIVDNKPGASNKIATDFVAKSPPDGYTLLSVGSSAPLTEAAAIATKSERLFDTLRDFTPISTIASNTYALVVNASLPIRNVHEFIAYAKARPGEINYGSAGIAKTDHVAAELFAQGTGIKMVHVPFKGIAEAITQMVGGQIQACFSALAPMAPHIKSGKLRLLGVVSSERSLLFPDAPTLAEAVPLPGYAVEAWIGVVGPAKMPPAIAERLDTEIARMLKNEAFVKQQLLPNGLEPFHKSPSEFASMFRGEIDKYARLFEQIGVKLN